MFFVPIFRLCPAWRKRWSWHTITGISWWRNPDVVVFRFHILRMLDSLSTLLMLQIVSCLLFRKDKELEVH